MIKIKSLLTGAVLASSLLMPAALAQGVGQLAPGQVWGNFGTAQGPAVPSLARERISAARTYYVRVAGSDTNCTGLTNVNDPGTGAIPRACAFATPQKPVSYLLKAIDLNGFTVTIDLTGSFTSGILAAGTFVGAGNSTIGGPGSVIVTSTAGASITTTDADAISATQGASLTVGGGNLTLSTTGTKGNCLSAYNGGTIIQGGVTYGAAAGGHIQAGWVATPSGLLTGPGTVYIANSYTITGGGIFHWHVPIAGSVINVTPGITVTLIGTPVFSAFFAGVTKGLIATSAAPGVTFVGSATGSKYLIHNGGVITGFPVLPGSLPGTIAGLGTIATQASEADTYTGIGFLAGLLNAAPAAPAVGQTWAWFDSTSLRFHDKDSNGVVGTTVVADAGASNQFLTAISTAGVISKAQPSFSNISGTLLASQLPALAGDITTAGGALATTLATVNSNVGTCGDATHVAQITLNGKGLATACAPVAITGAAPTGAAGGDLGGTYPNPTINNAAVITKVLTGYTSGPGTVSAADSILSALQKINGNDALKLPLAGGTMTGAILFSTDNTIDIGASGATRPRTGYFGTSLLSPLHTGGSGAASTLTLQSTSGAGTTDAIIGLTGSQVERFRITTGGLFNIGPNVAPDALLTVNANAGATVAPVGPTALLHLVSADATDGWVTMDAFGGAPRVAMRRADGTLASKTAVLSGEVLGSIVPYGWDGSAYSFGANFQFVTAENYGANRGTLWRVFTTPIGSSTIAEAMRANPSGGLSVGSTTDGGIGVILANRYLQSGAVAVGSLPTCNAAAKAARYFVTDSNAASYTAGIGAVVAAGGSTNVPVVCDGTNWRVGANDNIPDQRRKYA
jgi:hypothetical protein